MVRLIECDSGNHIEDFDCVNENSLDCKYLRSGKSYSNDTSSRPNLTAICPKKPRSKLNVVKRKLSQSKSKTKNKQNRYVTAAGRCVFIDALDKIMCDDIIREILLRLPWTLIKSFNTKRSLHIVSDPSFTGKYRIGHPFLLGFSYKIARGAKKALFKRAKFVSLSGAADDCCPQYVDLLKQNVESTKLSDFYDACLCEVPEHRLTIPFDASVCSCAGIILRVQLRDPAVFISLHDPVSGKSVFLPSSPPANSGYQYAEKSSYGLAIDFFSSHGPDLKVVELVVIKSFDGPTCVAVSTFSSKTCSWRSKVYCLESILGEHCLLSSQGIHLDGVIYWLKENWGVLAYNIKKSDFCLGLLKLPGEPIDGLCFCQENRTSTCREPWSFINRIRCVCRYLGVSEGRLCYIRVIAHSEISMWILESGKWSDKKRLMIQGLPFSLAYGRIISLDPQDCKLLYIRLKMKIYSYHLEGLSLNEIHTISFDGDSNTTKREGYISPIIAYDIPKPQTSVAIGGIFDDIFGRSLCSKDTCWDDAYIKYMIRPDVHLHSSFAAGGESTASFGNTLSRFFECSSDEDWRSRCWDFSNESECITL